MRTSKRLMWAQEVADETGLHVQTIYKWVREHKAGKRRSPIPFVPIGTRNIAFPRSKVEAFVNGDLDQADDVA